MYSIFKLIFNFIYINIYIELYNYNIYSNGCYDDCSLIDPYNLLGVTINSTPKEVKQAYYNLALLCHR